MGQVRGASGQWQSAVMAGPLKLVILTIAVTASSGRCDSPAR